MQGLQRCMCIIVEESIYRACELNYKNIEHPLFEAIHMVSTRSEKRF